MYPHLWMMLHESMAQASGLPPEEQQRLAKMSPEGIKASQMIIGALPILAVYPFLQKYFITGITLGSVKE